MNVCFLPEQRRLQSIKSKVLETANVTCYRTSMVLRSLLTVFGAAVCIAAPGGNASAQNSGVQWLTPPVPTGEDYPGFAALIGVGGSVTLECLARLSGGVSDCQIVEAHPRDLGFETAAIVVASRGVMEPARINGLPYEGRFRFNVPFSQSEEGRGQRPERPDIPAPSAKALSLARQVVDVFGAGPMIQPALGGLSLERRNEVLGWATRDFVTNDRVVREAVIQMVATALTEDEMLSVLRGGTVRTGGRQDVDLGEYLLWEADLGAMLRTKYCAKYDC